MAKTCFYCLVDLAKISLLPAINALSKYVLYHAEILHLQVVWV